MERIPSFSIDHTKLKRGLYVSRIDTIGKEYITTFDIRMKEPNNEPVLDVPVLHTIEHIGATFLRNDKDWAEKTVYLGPMGCRTGCYILFKGKLESSDIVDIMKQMFSFMADFKGEIPGTAPEECGNYLSHNLSMANYESRKFLTEVLEVIKPENLTYPTI
ncbi:MAG: S-ribosylhomocysteine lyase [Spirochaetales bacterium]|nr:S-ribosylhomocysteine lyase [Spirochaetales bacterium]